MPTDATQDLNMGLLRKPKDKIIKDLRVWIMAAEMRLATQPGNAWFAWTIMLAKTTPLPVEKTFRLHKR